MRLLPLLFCLVVAFSLLFPIGVLADDLEKYEYYDTGDSLWAMAYGNNWFAQTFTTANPHTVDQVRLKLFRTGTPGIVTVGIRATDGSDHPTGADLASGTIDGDGLGTAVAGDWYEINLTSYALEASTMYAIVIRASDGDSSNYVAWRYNSAGSYASGAYESSTNGGVSWTTTSARDFMFEVWGSSSLEVLDPKVFQSVDEDGDWLVVFSYKNSVSPYADGGYDPREYFNIEFRETTTVVALIKMPAWGYRPAAFYINADDAASLTWGGDYRIRITGNPDRFGAPPYDEYTLVATDSDWYGESLTWLEDWVIQTAELIGEYDGEEYTQYVEHHGEVLTSDGAAIFTIGIPYLPQLVPDVFEYVTRIPGGGDETWTEAGVNDPETMLGTDLMTALDDFGGQVNLGGHTLAAFAMFAVYAGIGYFVYRTSNNATAAILVPSPLLIVAGYFGIVHLAIIATLGIIALAALVYILWFRTA